MLNCSTVDSTLLGFIVHFPPSTLCQLTCEFQRIDSDDPKDYSEAASTRSLLELDEVLATRTEHPRLHCCRSHVRLADVAAHDNVPEVWKNFVALNREMAAICPPIIERRQSLAQREVMP
jgi:hypothetical protein